MSKFSEEEIAAYFDGKHAALRKERYAGLAGIPECPYDDSQLLEAAAWWAGFRKATDDLIADKLSDING